MWELTGSGFRTYVRTIAIPAETTGSTDVVWWPIPTRNRALTIAPDWRHALSLSGDGTIRVWDLVTSKQRGRIDVRGRPSAIAIASGSRLALTGGEDGVARLWLIPIAPGEAGDPTPTDILSPGPSSPGGPTRPAKFLKPMLRGE